MWVSGLSLFLVESECGCGQLVRRWRLSTLDPPCEGEALYCHHYPVRALATSRNGGLVSGDASGELAIWSVREPTPKPSGECLQQMQA